MDHLVKVGLMGLVGRYHALDMQAYARGSQVVCRTARGLEVGEVICDVRPDQWHDDESFAQPSGDLLRRVGAEDTLIIERLERYRDRAFSACSTLLAERNLPGVLVDVEHLFDGESLFFYFLGEVTPEVESLTDELATTYERKVRFKKFAEKLAEGCGPDCGTGVSCGTSAGCSTCAMSAKNGGG